MTHKMSTLSTGPFSNSDELHRSFPKKTTQKLQVFNIYIYIYIYTLTDEIN